MIKRRHRLEQGSILVTRSSTLLPSKCSSASALQSGQIYDCFGQQVMREVTVCDFCIRVKKGFGILAFSGAPALEAVCNHIRNPRLGAGTMAQQLRALSLLTEDLGSASSTHRAALNHP